MLGWNILRLASPDKVENATVDWRSEHMRMRSIVGDMEAVYDMSLASRARRGERDQIEKRREKRAGDEKRGELSHRSALSYIDRCSAQC